MFDGEGATAGDGLGAEASAFMSEISGEQPTGKPEENAQIEYGLPLEGELEADPVGTDKQAEAELSLEDEFAGLVGKDGKFHDLFGKKVSDAVQNRFKNHADLQAQVDTYEGAIAPLIQKYGLKQGDIEGLSQAISQDEGLYQAEAEKAGLSIEQYMENLKLKAEAEQGRALMEAYEEQQHQNQLFERWDNEAAELQETFPNFDLGKEIENNSEFTLLLDGGAGVRQAFIATHLDDILAGMRQETATQTQAQVVNSIQQRAARPIENGVRRAPAVQRKTDPSTLSTEDIDKMFEAVEQGKQFRF